MSKRILIFSTAYYPFVGGAEIAVKEITDRLSGEFVFDLITLRLNRALPKEERLGGVLVYRVGFGIPAVDKVCAPFLVAFKTFSLNNRHPYDIFWGVMVSYASLGGIFFNSLRKIFFKKAIPTVLTLQEGDSEDHLRNRHGGLIHFSWKFALKRVDVLTAISSYLLRRGEEFGFKGRKFLIPNGVDVRLFEKGILREERKTIRFTWGIRDDDVVLITTSRLTKKNDISSLISSLKYLPETIFLVIIGNGEEERKLREQALSLGVNPRVRFLGFLAQEKIPPLLHASDIFIRPSLSEGMGNSFVEAMAAGVPVIATPVGGIVDFLFDPDCVKDRESTGLFCEVENPESIALKVKKYLDNPALRKQITISAKKMVEEKYDWGSISKDMGRVLTF